MLKRLCNLFSTIEKEDYVKRHTWATVNESTIENNFVEINYTIFEEDGINLLYNRTMRRGAIGEGFPLQYANLVYNANNYLPLFSPYYALPVNIIEYENLDDLIFQDNEVAAYFTNNIPGLGSGIIYGAEHPAFHQELGSCFGAVLEPPDILPTVFSAGSQETNYTIHDLQMSKLYNDRNKIHYRNRTFAQEDSEGWDAGG